MICDFELSLLNAIDVQLPEADLLGCFFHFRQALRRRLGKDGHIKKLKSDAHFNHCFNMFSGLAFIPEAEVKLLFSLMIGEQGFPEELKEFAKYFAATWIGTEIETENGTQTVDPVFLIKRWNCHTRCVTTKSPSNHFSIFFGSDLKVPVARISRISRFSFPALLTSRKIILHIMIIC